MTWRRTPKQLARRALKALGYNQQKISGIIINQVDPEILEETNGLSAGGPMTAVHQRRSA